MRIAIAGLGTIGRVLARNLADGMPGLTLACVAARDEEKARGWLDEEGIEVSRRHHVLEAEANSLINRGIDCTHAGDREQTAIAFHHVKDIFERDAWFRWRYSIRLEAAVAEHWLSQGDLDKARWFIDRLQALATEHEVHKYIAVAHELMARVSMASGDLDGAAKHFEAALAELDQYPVPVVRWKTLAGAARLKLKQGDTAGAKQAFEDASEIVNMIADNVKDEKLRNTFLNGFSSDYADLKEEFLDRIT